MAFTREEAQARLAAIADEGWREARARRIGRLPKRLRVPADRMFLRTRWDGGVPNHALTEWLDLSSRQRRRIFDAAAPGRGELLDRAWELGERLPYQTGWTRRAFHATGRPELYVARRAELIRSVAGVLAEYPGDAPWLAAWASYLRRDLGVVLAAEIDFGPSGDETLGILLDVVNGTHPIGVVSRSAVRALLVCDRVEAWEAVERLLVSAQRQEGIRQVVMETVDESHPEAFRRFAHLTVDQGLTRFAGVMRSVGVWFGMGSDVTDRRAVEAMLARVVKALDDRAAAHAAVASDDPSMVFAGLWAWAFNDAPGAAAVAGQVAADADPARRMAATHLLAELQLPDAVPHLLHRLDDPDRRVAWRAFLGVRSMHDPSAFDALERYLERIEQPRRLDPIGWEWLELEESPGAVITTMLRLRGDRHPVDLHRHLRRMDADTRQRYVRELVAAPATPEARSAMIDLAADRSPLVSRVVFDRLADGRLAAAEAPEIEALLTRTTGATRSAAISILLTQADADALASAGRLLASSKKPQRLGGLDLLRQLKDAGRRVEAVETLASDYDAARPKRSEAEQTLLDVLLVVDGSEPALDDGLGLFDPATLTPVVPVRRRRIEVTTPSYRRLISAADDLVEAHREHQVIVSNWAGEHEMLYGDVRFPPKPAAGASPGDAPLAAIWSEWWERQEARPFDVERALVTFEATGYGLHEELAARARPTPAAPLRYPEQVVSAVWWHWFEHGTVEGVEFLLDGLENALAMIPQEELEAPVAETGSRWGRAQDWRAGSALLAWLEAVATALTIRPDLRSEAVVARLWQLLVWLDRPAPTAPRSYPDLGLLLEARRVGAASEADVIDHLLGSGWHRGAGYGRYYWHRSLGEVTRRRPRDAVRTVPGMVALGAKVRDRVVEVELGRGDVPTAASGAALAIRSVPGIDRVVDLVRALGRSRLLRGWSWNPEQKSSVLSHLIRVSHPDEQDTPVAFRTAVEAAGIRESRLLELAVYAPQWARYVEHAVAWDGLEDAVYWLHAHTKDQRWSVDADLRDEWAAEIASRTPLTAGDLLDGAVDVDWFRRVIDRLGEERWEELLRYVKYTSGGGGHKRAEVFGEALRGGVTAEALTDRIVSKRHQDSVRALGLVPLRGDAGEQRADVLARYRTLEEFRRGSRQFGSQRRASEGRATDIALDNLARTAGYADPVRLQWEMEALEGADLANGPITVGVDDYSITLSIDTLGSAEIAVTRKGKRLKRVPAKLGKLPDVADLRDRATRLRRQVSRVRSSLEAASVRGDVFDPQELVRLHEHPVLRPMLGATLFITDAGSLGMPIDDGANLQTLDGAAPVVGDAAIRVVHPIDLLASGKWTQWQRRLFADEVVQPFKQVFRELYVPTAAERENGKRSSRYAGHQVNPRQAAGLFSTRGWISHPDGYSFKTFHAEGISAIVDLDAPLFTPAEVDGATLHDVWFADRETGRPVSIADVPARLFSEIMRDLDLVVSVAHMGGVDPEASASTVEMRTTLARETAMLLGLDNVRFAGSHVVVDGSLGSYTIHLGSGQVHRQPGGAVCIIPIGSQHRGRLFLPFADDDPRTAEVVAKTVMLANDHTIQDPTILEQLV